MSVHNPTWKSIPWKEQHEKLEVSFSDQVTAQCISSAEIKHIKREDTFEWFLQTRSGSEGKRPGWYLETRIICGPYSLYQRRLNSYSTSTFETHDFVALCSILLICYPGYRTPACFPLCSWQSHWILMHRTHSSVWILQSWSSVSQVWVAALRRVNPRT